MTAFHGSLKIIEDPVPCRFFGNMIGTRQPPRSQPIGVYGCSHPARKETTIDNCRTCRFYQDKTAFLDFLDADEASYQIVTPPPPVVEPARHAETGKAEHIIVDRYHNQATLENLYYNQAVFVILSGPSIKELDLSPLTRRGMMTFGVNNSPAIFRPNLWTFVDPARKFHTSIWADPTITKLVPVPRLKNRLRIKKPAGEFIELKRKARDAPNVFGYRRNADFNPATFLTEPTVNWGNSKQCAEANGYPAVLSVLLATIRLCYHLGFRRVYLLGCDFSMEEDKPPYAFDQEKTPGAVASNNWSYSKIGEILWTLRPMFDRAGFQVFNCFQHSKLKVFPYFPYEEAARGEASRIPNKLDTAGWYDPTPEDKPRKSDAPGAEEAGSDGEVRGSSGGGWDDSCIQVQERESDPIPAHGSLPEGGD